MDYINIIKPKLNVNTNDSRICKSFKAKISFIYKVTGEIFSSIKEYYDMLQ